MTIQNKLNPKVKNEISKEEWESLGDRKKLFTIVDSKDSAIVKESIISNSIGKGTKKDEKPGKK